MESPTPQPAPGSATFMEGCKDSLPIVISYIPVAFAFGLNATRLGFSPLESVFFSCIIYAGASHQPCTLEGIVSRNHDAFSVADFSHNVFKYVRKNHVKTTVHWKRHWQRARMAHEFVYGEQS